MSQMSVKDQSQNATEMIMGAGGAKTSPRTINKFKSGAKTGGRQGLARQQISMVKSPYEAFGHEINASTKRYLK